MVTKDGDFRDSYLLKSSPRRLLLVETGKTSNNDLMGLFDKNLAQIVGAFTDSTFVEWTMERLVVHGD